MIEEALHIILDPGHIVAEVVMELLSYLTIGRAAIWWHDRKHHAKPILRTRGRVRQPRPWRAEDGW